MPASPDPTLDVAGSVLPESVEPLPADEMLRLEDLLADAGADEERLPIPIGRTPALDFTTRQFVPNTAGGPLMLYGHDTLRQWVEKCLRTLRGSNAACHPSFGVDRLWSDLLDGQGYDPGAMAEYQGIVGRALAVSPSIESVGEWDVEYEPGDDAVYLSFSIFLADADEDQLEYSTTLTIGN